MSELGRGVLKFDGAAMERMAQGHSEQQQHISHCHKSQVTIAPE
jgi:hypothetical protein